MAELAGDRRLVAVTETDGLDAGTLAAVTRALTEEPGIDAVYSIGGGNAAVLARVPGTGARTAAASWPTTWTRENVMLLRRRQLTAVLHHDLRRDVAEAARLILHARGCCRGGRGPAPRRST